MKNTKLIASIVALALGASALVVPAAEAQPVSAATATLGQEIVVHPDDRITVDVANGRTDSTRYRLKTVPSGWTAEVNARTGHLTVTAPMSAEEETSTVNFVVTATTPDGVSEDVTVTVNFRVRQKDLYQPVYKTTISKPEGSVVIELDRNYEPDNDESGENPDAPADTTFALGDEESASAFKAVIDEKTGTVTATIPRSVTPGSTESISVKVSYPDGTVEYVSADVNVLGLPAYHETRGWQGAEVVLGHTGRVGEGTKFEVAPGQSLGSWRPQVDETTGRVTVTIPDDAKGGEVKEIFIKVTDPNDPDNPETVSGRVIVYGAPNYPEKSSYPGGGVVAVPDTATTPRTNYQLTPGQDLGNWEPAVDPKTGVVSVIVPKGAAPGERKEILVDATYPGGKVERKKETIPVTVAVTQKPQRLAPNNASRDSVLTVVRAGVPDVGTYAPQYEILGRKVLPDGGRVSIDPRTGEVTAVLPKGTAPGTKISVPVKITRVTGTNVYEEFVITVPDVPKSSGGYGTVVVLGKGEATDVEVPKGWSKASIGEDLALTIPGNTKRGTYPLSFATAQGKETVNILVGRQPNFAVDGSSEGISKCFNELQEQNSPLLWLLPLGLLAALTAPLAAPLGNALGRGISQLDIPNPFAQIQSEATRLQQQLGLEVPQGVIAALAIVGLAATVGVTAVACTQGPSIFESSKKVA